VRIATWTIAGAGLIVVAGFLHGPLKPLPWLAALGVGLVDRSGTRRIALARDVCTYLHLPMVAGIVLFAFAMKTTLGPTSAMS
jgi:low temperature requirement protein LtrA